MSSIYVEVWTLRRGIIDPPEPVLPSTQIAMSFEDQREYRRIRDERDPPIDLRDEKMRRRNYRIDTMMERARKRA